MIFREALHLTKVKQKCKIPNNLQREVFLEQLQHTNYLPLLSIRNIFFFYFTLFFSFSCPLCFPLSFSISLFHSQGIQDVVMGRTKILINVSYLAFYFLSTAHSSYFSICISFFHLNPFIYISLVSFSFQTKGFSVIHAILTNCF